LFLGKAAPGPYLRLVHKVSIETGEI